MKPADENSQNRNDQKKYPPSILNRFMTWIDRLPGPTWAFYFVVTVIFILLGHGLRWMDGTLQPGEFDPEVFANYSLSFYAIALLSILNRTAEKSLSIFRPALGKLEDEYERLQYELTTMPPRFFLVITVISLFLTGFYIISNPEAWGISGTSSLVTNVFSVMQSVLEIVPFIGVIFHIIRQLRLIGYIHRSATNINLFESKSHHAFSRLTMQAAIGLVVPIYYFTFIIYLFDLEGISGMSLVDLGVIISMIIISMLIFITPLIEMRNRLVREKSRLMMESDLRFESVTIKLHHFLDSGSYENIDGLTKAMTSLGVEKERLKKISTWPWEVDTMRSFLSSIGLPLLLWLITSLLGKIIN